MLVAYRGKIKLAAEIALASSAQVAVFLIPAVTLLALLIEPLALAFRPVEIAALAISVIVASILLADGRSTRLKGVVLIVVYVGIAIAFYQAGDAPKRRTRAASARGIASSARVDVLVADVEVRDGASTVGWIVPESATPCSASQRDRLLAATRAARRRAGRSSSPTAPARPASPAAASPTASRRARAWSSASRSTWWSSA